MEQGAEAGLPQLSVQGPLWKGCEGHPHGCSSALPGAGLVPLLSASLHPHHPGAQGSPSALTAPPWMTGHGPGPHLQRCLLPQEPLSTIEWLGVWAPLLFSEPGGGKRLLQRATF